MIEGLHCLDISSRKYCHLLLRPTTGDSDSDWVVAPKKKPYIHLWINIITVIYVGSRSQWPRGLRRSYAAACLLRSWVRIPPGAWMFVVSVVCCQVEVSATSWSLIQRSPIDCGASLCDLETSRLRPWPALGLSSTKKKRLLGQAFEDQDTVLARFRCQFRAGVCLLVHSEPARNLTPMA
jgi:hypothetical protein